MQRHVGGWSLATEDNDAPQSIFAIQKYYGPLTVLWTLGEEVTP